MHPLDFAVSVSAHSRKIQKLCSDTPVRVKKRQVISLYEHSKTARSEGRLMCMCFSVVFSIHALVSLFSMRAKI